MIVPLCITGLAYVIGIGEIDDGLALKTILILSVMPPAFISIISDLQFRCRSGKFQFDTELWNIRYYFADCSIYY